MTNNIDFNALKARAMGSGTDEEAVTVNTRALIDKVLARYSGEWTVLRELLQNAADASATTAIVKFETVPSTSVPVPPAADATTLMKHVISHHTLKRLVFRNNGVPFNEKDWARLKRIAEGNPDETKIGAFGVGFYSVFSDCEEPFVSSGNEAMAFYWKGNALYTRRLKLDEADCSRDTSFVLDHRNTTTPIPALRPLCEFLAGSLTFSGLETIELWLDDWNLLKLSKKLSPSVTVPIPKDVRVTTEQGFMKVTSVEREMAQMDAVYMKAVDWKSPSSSSRFDVTRNDDPTASLKSFFSRLTGNSSKKCASSEHSAPPPEDITLTTSSTVFLHSTTVYIRTSVSQSFSRELERATKKPPPKNTKMSLLTSSFGVGPEGTNKSSDILSAVLPVKSGRVHIGFATHQTTGLSGHISAPSVIPTVERESIDLNARWVRTWNMELLGAAGIMCRIAWSAEMDTLKEKLSHKMKQSGRTKPDIDDVSAVLPDAVHVSNQFVFRESTPAAQVGQAIENSFWTCSQNAYLEVLSTRGILPSLQVRISPKDLSFMEGIPALPDEYMSGAEQFVKRLTDLGLITDITISDIKKELEANTISPQQLTEFISWVANRSASGKIDRPTVKALLGVAVAEGEVTDGRPTGLVVLKDISDYLNPTRIPADLPIPPFVMPFQHTKSLSINCLNALGWEELQVDAWVRWLVGDRANLSVEHDMTRTPAFSARVLPILSKQWDSINPSGKESALTLLKSHTVIPTKLGMRKPGEAYFPSVRLFDDLPVVTPINSVKERFLMALGVRKTVELNVIFDRLLGNNASETGNEKSGHPKWSHVDLIKYLASVRGDIPSEDIKKLSHTRICTAEVDGGQKAGTIRYCVSELYEPNDSLRILGLPLLYWPERYSSRSPEGQFLSLLGIRSFPSPEELIQLMAQAQSEKNNNGLADKARKYFISEHAKNGYENFDYSKVTVAFLPIEGGGSSTPSRCFTDPGASLFGFQILRKDLHFHGLKFGVAKHPPILDCINILLLNPPRSTDHARIVFEYLSKRLPEIPLNQTQRVGQAAIVPTTQKLPSGNKNSSDKASMVRYVTPRECYIGTSEEYEDIFDFVDFGELANAFLLACGSKREPSTVELAKTLVKEPAKISDKLQTTERYLKLLRNIAANMSTIRKDKDLFREMKRAPFLLASRELISKSTSKSGDGEAEDIPYEEEEQSIKEWELLKAADAVIVDDYASFSLFRENILAAPQEEHLEDMYMALGTPCLSHIVEEQARCGSPAPDQSAAASLQKRIYERSRLFLHDLPPELVRHDGTWLERRLSVQVVRSISLCRSLRGRRLSHVEKRSAAVIQKSNSWILYITGGKIDFYQVSQALVHLILSRATLHFTLTLEMLLRTDLMELRARGYNVDRILKKKQAEDRMAEAARKQQYEEERRQMQQESASRPGQDLLHSMPGFFPDSPSQIRSNDAADPAADLQTRGTSDNSVFSNLSKRLGLSDFLQPNEQRQSRDTGNADTTAGDAPPPYSPEDPKTPKPTAPSAVSSPQALQKNLLSAVNSCRPHGSSAIYSRGEQNQVAETKTYCDERPSHDLVFVGDSYNKIKLFLPRTDPEQSKFMEQNRTGLDALASILADCASVFQVKVESISIFFDAGGKTIAFNRQGSIFCNYSYFQQLHQSRVIGGQRVDALVYWWVIFCHELAHNLVGDHNSHHSYYTEGFVTEYFPKVARKIAEYETHSHASTKQ